MKIRKIITMGLAAIMAVSAMSISAMAEENVTQDENIDFYNTVQIVTYNTETGEFDSAYEPVLDVMPMTFPDYTFHFAQYVGTAGRFLKNIDDNEDEGYTITDDDTMVVRLDNKPSKQLTMYLCRYNGTVWGDSINITTSYVKIIGLSSYFSQYGNLKIKMATSSGTEYVSGSVSEN